MEYFGPILMAVGGAILISGAILMKERPSRNAYWKKGRPRKAPGPGSSGT